MSTAPCYNARLATGFHALVVIAVEIRKKGMGRIRLQRIPAATTTHLVGFIKRTIVEGSTVVTDGWRPYEALGPQYPHRRHPIEGSGDKASALLPRVH
ncbi:MAG: transposase, partial [Elusimicrobia bacterium]|nr:transposase [Elusimicrobiota bacterium]